MKPKRDLLDYLTEWTPIGLMVILFFVYLFFALGCAMLSGQVAKPITSSSVLYRRDIQIEVDGKRYAGVATLPAKDSYHFKVTTKHDMDRFKATSCHRQIVEDNVGKSGWFSKKSSYEFDYPRTSDIERTGPCPLQLEAGADDNEFSWGFIDFNDSGFTLPAIVNCDGAVINATLGASDCQSRADLAQEIFFSEPVTMDVQTQKAFGFTPKGVNGFEFKTPPGRNEIAFCNVKKTACHRLTTIGYGEVWVRSK